MGMILNDIWPYFNAALKSGLTTDVTRKQLAINAGLRYIPLRIAQLKHISKAPKEMLATENLATTSGENYSDLPDDFFRINKVWILSGTAYIPIPNKSIISYEEMQRKTGQTFHDATSVGPPQFVAEKGAYLYYDKAASADGTADVKLEYWKLHSLIAITDKLTHGVVTGGPFVAEEIITGEDSDISAKIKAVETGYLDLYSLGRDGEFNAVEKITGATSSAYADTSKAIETKTAALTYVAKNELLVIESCVLQYYRLKGSSEIRDQSILVDNLIDSISILNSNTNESWG